MKYLKYFKTDVDCQNYFSSDEFVTPNVSYAEGSDTMYFKPYVGQETDNLIIMTSESNPEVMKVCYNQGWAASPYKMYASEAARVTSIGTAFERLGGGNSDGYGYNEYSSGYDSPSASFTFSFDEFKYFTGVTSIDAYAFSDSNIVSITIPNSVTSIGGSAFRGCSSLTSITIGNSVISIGDTAFIYCSMLTSIIIPDSVTSIGVSTFNSCTGLTSITIGNSVTSIGKYAFRGCNSLPVEDNLRYADTYLVGAVDKSLSTYTIKEGTKWIGEDAFNQCKGLTSINIPDSVTSIGESAFYKCSMLNNITCLATTAPSIYRNTFQSIKYSGTLEYPSGSDYSSWVRTGDYYLGKYNWTTKEKEKQN